MHTTAWRRHCTIYSVSQMALYPIGPGSATSIFGNSCRTYHSHRTDNTYSVLDTQRSREIGLFFNNPLELGCKTPNMNSGMYPSSTPPLHYTRTARRRDVRSSHLNYQREINSTCGSIGNWQTLKSDKNRLFWGDVSEKGKTRCIDCWKIMRF